jgi:hypothetical protein
MLNVMQIPGLIAARDGKLLGFRGMSKTNSNSKGTSSMRFTKWASVVLSLTLSAFPSGFDSVSPTYTGAQFTISGNPGDVSLVVSADPEAGFAATPGSTIPCNQIQIQGTTGGAGSGVNAPTVTLSTTSGSAALVYQVDRTNGRHP